jgi:hypothetical protein
MVSFAIGTSARADDPNSGAGAPSTPAQTATQSEAEAQANLVNQANAPIASIFQMRLQDSYTPKFDGTEGTSNALLLAVTMPLRKYRLLPFPQLSLLTIPASVKFTGAPGGFGDVRFLDIALLDVGHRVLFGIGPTFVFPTATDPATGQGKWQAGPAAAIAFAPDRWLLGILAQNPISFAGSGKRRNADALFLQPFVTYQLDDGWFVRSQPQLTFDWKSHKQYLPLDLAFGRVFKVEEQNVSCFLEMSRNLSQDEPAPRYTIALGVSLLFPNFAR